MARFEAKVAFPAKTDKDFVHLARHMLHHVRECRASIDQVLHHPWMTAKGSTSIDTHVPSRPALVASPDVRAVAEVQRFGFSKADVLTSVATIALDQRDPAVSLYHLAHEKIERKRHSSAMLRPSVVGLPTDSDKTMAGDDQPPPASDSTLDMTTQSDMPAASVLAEMERVLQSKGIAYTPQTAAGTGLAHVLVCEDNRGHRRQARFEIRLEPQLLEQASRDRPAAASRSSASRATSGRTGRLPRISSATWMFESLGVCGVAARLCHPASKHMP
ncbi:hypothetical protein BC831DRAFT_505647 [Entophlyctis helioformis]|nr:hypothetical protein BC831DRAFT_505647 [Entophlyctis helioformis]